METVTVLVRRRAGWAALLFFATLASAVAQPSAAEVKAVFTFNFLQYVNWPATAFESPQSPVVIGVWGDAEMAGVIGRVVAGERARGRPVQVLTLKEPAQVRACHILYVAPGAEGILRGGAMRRPLLTIGETDAFISAGGVIRFITDRNRVKLQVNLPAARDCSLEISSQLLRIAETIGRPP